MNILKNVRESKGLSQRQLGKLANLSYKSIQLLEGGEHDPKLSTLEQIARALGYPRHAVRHRLEDLFSSPSDSIAMISERIVSEGELSWPVWLFNFVDAFCKTKDRKHIENPPIEKTPPRVKALLASTVETLCDEMDQPYPWWCAAIGSLEKPWFVAEVENLKAMALVESSIHFRKRNIFVLKNFLERV